MQFAPSDYVYQNSIGQYRYPQLIMSTLYQTVPDATGISSPLITTVDTAVLDVANGQDVYLPWVPIFNIPDEFFVYDGSFTYPDCHQDVTWYITTQIQNVKQSDAASIITAIQTMYGNGGNARPTQPLNGRVVKRRSTFTSVYLN